MGLERRDCHDEHFETRRFDTDLGSSLTCFEIKDTSYMDNACSQLAGRRTRCEALNRRFEHGRFRKSLGYQQILVV